MTAPNTGVATIARSGAASRLGAGAASASVVPIRASAREADAYDTERVTLVRNRWDAQDVLLAPRDRQIEENVRMLVGRQWEVYSPSAGRFVDVTQFMSDAERAFRQRPVVNRLLYWFILTHARLTESPPVVSFQPSTADRLDAQLAEVMDPIFKTLWLETGMLEVIDRLMAWVIPAGQAYLKSRIDFSKGARVQPAPVSVPADPATDVSGGDPQPEEQAEAQAPQASDDEREGALTVDVLSALEVRGEWNAKPWHEKAWHIQLSYLTPAQVYALSGMEVAADTSPLSAGTVANYLTRILFGAGHYGAAGGGATLDGSATATGQEGSGYVAVYEMWEAPDPSSPETADSPGGRLLVTTRTQVLYDSARPFRLRGASPIRSFPFVNLPGRPSGTSPQEMMNPIQRAYNRGWAQILEHRALMTNPMIELDAASGLSADDFVSRPGSVVTVRKRPGVDAFRFVAPPQLSNDVWRTQDMLANVLDMMGNVDGAMGAAPTSDSSGDLVKELRFNSDRFIGPTAKRTVLELARMVEDWIAMLAVAWTQEKVIAYAGQDNVARTITVAPEMFAGKVNVFPDTESMLPEGRGERQARVQQLYELGVFGQPGSPEAVKTFLELSRFPHLSRTMRPGGVDRVTAEHLLGRLLQGEPAAGLPVLEWYDVGVHLAVFEDYMKSPEFLAQQPPVQGELTAHYNRLHAAAQVIQQQATAQQAKAAMQAAQLQAVAAGMTSHLSTAGQVAAQPPDPPAPASATQSAA